MPLLSLIEYPTSRYIYIYVALSHRSYYCAFSVITIAGMLCSFLTLSILLVYASCMPTENHLLTADRSDQDSKVLEIDLKAVSTGVYAAEIYVGNPPRPAYVSFDTGSSDSWIRPDDYSQGCEKEGSNCSFKSLSSTYKSLNTSFSVIYGSGAVNGTWAEDEFRIGSASIPSYRFGVAKSISLEGFNVSLIGLGLEGFESTYTRTYGVLHKQANTYATQYPRSKYPNFPVRLKQEGAIEKTAYSIYYPVKDEEAKLIFGGVDSGKYDSLFVLPIIQKSAGAWTGYSQAILLAVSLDQLSLKYQNNSYPILGRSYPALMDTLTYSTYIPQDAIDNLVTLLGGYYDSSLLGIIYKCSNLVDVEVDFSGSKLKTMLTDLSDQEGDECLLSVTPSPDEYVILGSSFLSLFYTYFNLEDLEIGIGNYVDKGCNNIYSTTSGVPRSSRAPKYNSTFYFSKFDTTNCSYRNSIFKSS